MNPLLRKLLARYQAPAGDDGADTGGTGVLNLEESDGPEDRGDVVDPSLNTETLQALVAAEGGDGGAGDPPTSTGVAALGGDEDGAPGGKPADTPNGRLNEVDEQRKEAERRAEAAERELAALRVAAQTPQITPAAAPPKVDPAFDEDAKEQAYVEALMNGDAKAAAAIRREISTHVRAEAAAQAIQYAQAEHEQRVMASALQTQSDLALKTYPYLDTAEGAEALELIIALRNAKAANGVPMHEALRAAVDAIAPKFQPQPRGDRPPSKVSPEDRAAADLRTAKAIARGATDSLAQPPVAQVGIGNRAAAARIDIEALTDEQFAALSAEEKKRLRGD